MKEKKYKYSIEYHKGLQEFILWKEVESEKGFNVVAIYKGTKKECREKLNELKHLVNN